MSLGFTSCRPLGGAEALVPKSFWWITAGTFQKRPYIQGPDRKQMLFESLDFNAYKWGWRLVAYVMLDNHYHLVAQSPPGDISRLTHVVQSAHSFSAHHWRLEDPSIRSRIWWNFWEAPLASLDAVRRAIVYAHANPSMHGACAPLEIYPHSSHRAYRDADPATMETWDRQYAVEQLDPLDSF